MLRLGTSLFKVEERRHRHLPVRIVYAGGRDPDAVLAGVLVLQGGRERAGGVWAGRGRVSYQDGRRDVSNHGRHDACGAVSAFAKVFVWRLVELYTALASMRVAL
eukprot:1327933-Pyramimonas_sp.AAC.1